MFCRKCGKTIPDDSIFCPYCGETVKLIETNDANDIIEKPIVERKCEQCGKPLKPDNDGTLCDECTAKLINNYAPNYLPNESYPYGACGKCGEPLEADDNLICKKCLNEENERKNYFSKYDVPKEPKSTSHHAGAIWLVATFIVSIVLVVCFGGSGNATDVSTSSSASSSVSEVQSSSIPSSALPISSIDDTPSSAGIATNCGLELISNEGTVDTSIGSIHITGEIKNTSGNTLSYAQIQFALYDKSGAQVGTALANTNGLEPDKIWKYDAIGMASNIDTFKPINMWAY